MIIKLNVLVPESIFINITTLNGGIGHVAKKGINFQSR